MFSHCPHEGYSLSQRKDLPLLFVSDYLTVVPTVYLHILLLNVDKISRLSFYSLSFQLVDAGFSHMHGNVELKDVGPAQLA